jgi:L,D-transpeptidase YbiS
VSRTSLRISLREQSLALLDDDHVVKTYSISTAANGAGEESGSGQTPRGRHDVRELIGANQPSGVIFVGRQSTGDVWTPELQADNPDRDWMLSRIIRLGGLEDGRNSGASVDTFERCIYIHGASDHAPMGVPRSRGCIRMRNDDVIDLFGQIRIGTIVEIDD